MALVVLQTSTVMSVHGQQTAEDWFIEGNNLLAEGDYALAVLAYNEVIRLDPSFAVAWNNKGEALRNLDEYGEAIKCFDEAIRLDPGLAVAWNNRGVVLYNQGKYSEAIQAYDMAITLDPEFLLAVDNKNLALEAVSTTSEVNASDGRDEKDYSESASLSQLASQIFSSEDETAASLTDRGDELAKQERFDDALSCYDEAIKLDPDYLRAHERKCDILLYLFRTSEYATAKYDYNIAKINKTIEQEFISKPAILQMMMGEWHLPAGDIEITEEDLTMIETALNSHPFYSERQDTPDEFFDMAEAVLKDHPMYTDQPSLRERLLLPDPSMLFVYAMIKCHHLNGYLVPPSSAYLGMENLTQDWEEKYGYVVSDWTKMIIIDFWTDYIYRDFTGRSDFGTEEGIIFDFVTYLDFRNQQERLERLKNYADMVSLQTEVYVHDAHVMSDIREYEQGIIEREQISATKRSSYLAEWSANWAIGQAEYEVWKSQISRIREGTY